MLRIGILGAARVAIYALIAPAREVDDVIVSGVAARDAVRAKAYADANGIPTVYPDYASLIASPDIDAVYNALPPSLHAQWSIAALAAGKPVLCEKPFALSLADVDAMLAAEAQTGLLLMEAQHSHYHPLSTRMRAVVSSGHLGEIRHVHAHFNAPVADTGTELRYIADVGGGALWDLGIYPAYWIRSITGQEPQVINATQRLHPGGADCATEADLLMPSGATARLTCDMQAPMEAWVRVEGSRGVMEVTNPLAPQLGHVLKLTIDGATVEEHFSRRSTYAYQLEAFRDAVTKGSTVATRGDDTRATVALLVAIRDAARNAARKDG